MIMLLGHDYLVKINDLISVLALKNNVHGACLRHNTTVNIKVTYNY